MSVPAATGTPDITDGHGQRPYGQPDLQLHVPGPPTYGHQDRAVGPDRPGPGHLEAQHHHLMVHHQDLRVLRRLAAAQQGQPPEHPDHKQVQQTDRHELRSCPSSPTKPNRSSQTLHRVLKRYRVQRPESADSPPRRRAQAASAGHVGRKILRLIEDHGVKSLQPRQACAYLGLAPDIP